MCYKAPHYTVQMSPREHAIGYIPYMYISKQKIRCINLSNRRSFKYGRFFFFQYILKEEKTSIFERSSI